jgi:hypothetical protein
MPKYLIAWVPMIFIAILNGILRENIFTQYLTELRAHQASTLSLIIFFAIYIWALIRFWKPESSSQALWIGIIWLGMTIIFEFGFGHFVMGHPWSRLFNDYNLLAGRVWIFVLLWVAVAPWLFYRIQE